LSTIQPKKSAPSERLKSTRLERAAEVIRLEARTIAQLESQLGPSFEQAVDWILECQGMVVITGMGKAGLIGAKISASLASTGTPSHVLHPSEALHGDLGRIRAHDLLIVISNSGESAEIKALIPAARKIGARIVAMTGKPESTLARLADCVLNLGRIDEACPMGLAPTASTSAMLALGDALAMVVLDERGFSREDYARYHPAGALGRKLMRVEEIMRKDAELPLVKEIDSLADVLLTMTQTPGKPGAALVIDGDGRLCGIFTDGDLRRVLKSGKLPDGPVKDHMGPDPKFVTPDQLVDDAERMLHEHRVDQIPVVDELHHPVGLIDVQDVLDVRI
jgi:arabinose-5-phosphate isomerase